MNHQRAAFLVMLAFFALAPAVVYPLFLMKVMCFALFACAFNLLIGYGGLLSFGHAMFFGFAGYVSAHAAKVWGFNPEFAILAAVGAAALLGAAAGLIAIRRQGIYFAMITLALAQGLLAYEGDRAVGWVALAPRERYVRLETARTLKPVDEKPVWSVVCFFVAREWRGRGVTVQLLRAAADYAASKGATLLEGYPVDPGKKWADAYAFTGLVGAFERAGFREVARPSKTRAIMRKAVRRKS